MMNVANPERAFDFAAIPNCGVGLARIEFMINRNVGVHLRALLELDGLDGEIKERVRAQMAGYSDPRAIFVDKLSEGVAQIAAAFAASRRRARSRPCSPRTALRAERTGSRSCEIPTNALLADRYLDHFDGMSIGSNDMTQLTLGVDRDSGIVAKAFDERDDAVETPLAIAIHACRKRCKYVGICGQGPSDHPDFALWLLQQGIDSISLNPDSVLETWLFLARQAHR